MVTSFNAYQQYIVQRNSKYNIANAIIYNDKL